MTLSLSTSNKIKNKSEGSDSYLDADEVKKYQNDSDDNSKEDNLQAKLKTDAQKKSVSFCVDLYDV